MLQGEKISLRTVQESDLEILYRLVSSPESWSDHEPFVAIDWFTFERGERERGASPSRGGLFLMELNRDKSIVGAIFHRESHPTMKNTEIGYIVDSAYRKKGAASEAARLMVEYLFKNKVIERIEAGADVENVASQRVLEKCGFKCEGTMRKARFVGGVYRDYLLYSILREDWRPQQIQGRITREFLDPDLMNIYPRRW
jgi:ribosomal-protein-alanine N-acetyltransferase